MLLRFFRTNGAIIIVTIPLIGIILWLAPFLNASRTPLLSDQIRLPLYESLFGFILHKEVIQEIVAFILVMAVAFLLVRLNTRFIIINNRTYLPALIYVLIVSGIPELQKLNPALISSFFMLFIIEKVLDSYRYENLFYGFFTAAFVIGVGSLIYPFSYSFWQPCGPVLFYCANSTGANGLLLFWDFCFLLFLHSAFIILYTISQVIFLVSLQLSIPNRSIFRDIHHKLIFLLVSSPS